MRSFHEDECVQELRRRGWAVEVSEAGKSWKFTAVRGEQSWLYMAPDLTSLWIAARHMAEVDSQMPSKPSEQPPLA